ncbi:MAG: hypothetical protein IPK63_19595 [Candidatus Competibacteraceae bacterium]|nr:hypothetical protein [Candidatus Competibacteraceae bacterium]
METHQGRQIGTVDVGFASVGRLITSPAFDALGGGLPPPTSATNAPFGRARLNERAKSCVTSCKGDADPATSYPPVGLKLGHHLHRHIDRNGKGQAHVAAAAAENFGN